MNIFLPFKSHKDVGFIVRYDIDYPSTERLLNQLNLYPIIIILTLTWLLIILDVINLVSYVG